LPPGQLFWSPGLPPTSCATSPLVRF
jgi:hypothetical protein